MKGPIAFAEAWRFWLRLGCISFGGPAGQIAIMHRELVEQRRWISEGRFLHALNYCMVLPGPEAQQLATYLGWLMHGTWGGIVAGGLFILPSLALLILLSWIYMAFGQAPVVSGFLDGIKPAVTALVMFAAWRIGTRTLRGLPLKTIALAAFAALFWLNVPFPAIVIAAALLGILGGRLAPQAFAAGGHAPASTNMSSHDGTPALINDQTALPDHATFRLARCLQLVIVGLLLWFGAMGLLMWHSGWDGTLAQMGWFFTKAALLTFGGAYAVLPYVYQGAIDTYAWLTPQQMIDGLALGETTPGPLIMVVTFVGFVGGWAKAVLGPEHLFLGATLAAIVVTYFTFLPSFLFILIGGPLIEKTHKNLGFTAPLTAITAAVVGVIVSLGVFFAWKVWWPQATHSAPFDGPFSLFSAGLTIAAIIALTRFKVGVIPLILTCGALGVLRAFAA